MVDRKLRRKMWWECKKKTETKEERKDIERNKDMEIDMCDVRSRERCVGETWKSSCSTITQELYIIIYYSFSHCCLASFLVCVGGWRSVCVRVCVPSARRDIQLTTLLLFCLSFYFHISRFPAFPFSVISFPFILRPAFHFIFSIFFLFILFSGNEVDGN